MLFFSGGGMLSLFWMQLSIALFLAVQLFDHFWADRREKEIEQNSQVSIKALKIWMILKLGLYASITILMVLKC